MNKFKILTLNFLLLIAGCTSKQEISQFNWRIEDEKEHNNNRNDPTKWSQKNWTSDMDNFNIYSEPMMKGIFPVPDYNLADSTFSGLGNSGSWKGIDFNGKKIIYHSFFVNNCNVNKAFIPNKPNEVFFSILVLTDSVDLNKYSHTNVSITSRNHPHYVGQGFVKTSENIVDFISFISADRNEYALVNLRLFDLKIGRIVLIAPQKDGSLRSLQLTAPIMSSDEMDSYTIELLERNEEVIEFFKEKGNI